VLRLQHKKREMSQCQQPIPMNWVIIPGSNMRLWSIHPRYLDHKGLVALWREGLLAQKVLQGGTRGYTNHPQLIRFKNTANPVGAIAEFLRCVADEADNRGYRFDRGKIADCGFDGMISITSGQAKFEIAHLLRKLKKRDPGLYLRLNGLKKIELHPKFKKIAGDVADWEVRVRAEREV
jgi:hypothetical protein